MPLAVILTGANVHDVTQLLSLIDAIPPTRITRHSLQRLRVICTRFERRAAIHGALFKLGCCLICWSFSGVPTGLYGTVSNW